MISLPLCIVLSCASSNFQLCTQKCDHLPPPKPIHFSNSLFSQISQKNTYPPPREQYFGASDQKLRKPEKKFKKTH